MSNNPVAARMVKYAEDYRWSSTPAHIAWSRTDDDPLTDLKPLRGTAPNWKAMWGHGLIAGRLSLEGEAEAEAIEARLRTGRPLAAEGWIAEQEAVLDRRLRPLKSDPKPKVQKTV